MKLVNDAKLIKEITAEIAHLAKANGISPGDMVTFTAIALVNLQVILSKPGMQREAFEAMVSGMRAAFKVLEQEETIQ
jgi:hypothetical protein